MSTSLGVYYARHFPGKLIARWLSYGNYEKKGEDGDLDLNDPELPSRKSPYLFRREVAFMYGSIMSRFNSFTSAEEFDGQMKDKSPDRIEYGSVYDHPPREKGKWAKIVAQERELVFDIDLTDYDDVRNCCSEAKICKKCWIFMTAASKVLHGRRGMHCWVGDRHARTLTSPAREALLGYLSLTSTQTLDARAKVFERSSIHPLLCECYEILEPYWMEALDSSCQDFLRNPKTIETVLKCVRDESIRNALQDSWGTTDRSSVERWHELCSLVGGHCKEEIVLYHMHPRLDREVSIHMHHLLKSPFVVHPKTDRVCVPIDPKKMDQFNPETVVRMKQLLTDDPETGKPEKDLTVEVGLLQSFVDGLEDEMMRECKEMALDRA